MSLIKPLKGCFYNPARFKNWRNLVCPPYDIIAEKDRKIFCNLSKYNFCRVLLASRNKNYKSLKERFNGWLKKGVFVQDSSPYIYLYEQRFFLDGEPIRRLGFFALLDLEKKNRIFAHESTLKQPKKDRFQVLKELKVNLDPIFVISNRHLDTLTKLDKIYRRKKPFIDFKDREKIHHRLWRIEEDTLTKELAKEVNRAYFLIADGHHRFCVANQFYRLYKDRYKEARFLLSYFTHPSEGLVILPTHRIVNLEIRWDDFLDRVKENFYVEKTSQEVLIKRLSQYNQGVSFGMYANRTFYFLKLKNSSILDKIVKQKKFALYKKLDVYILHKVLFKKISIEDIDYTHSLEDIKNRVKNHRKVGFILRSIPLEMVFSFAKNSLLLPQKSTYFYPKLPSGLIFRKLEDEDF